MPDEQQGQEADSNETTTFDFDAWLGEQPEQVRSGIDSHTAGLKSALQQEREQRKDAIKQLRDMTGKAEQGSELAKQLAEMTTRAEQAEQRTAFFEDAGRAEIACNNPRAAYLIASADGMFTKRGEPDWAAIKAAAPELFGRKTPPGNAGSGNGNQVQPGKDMNNFIRTSAGRG